MLTITMCTQDCIN